MMKIAQRQPRKAQLQRLADLDGLSDDLFEKVEKALKVNE